MSLTPAVALTICAVLFAVGLFGALWRRDAAGLIASLAVTASAATMGLMSVSKWWGGGQGAGEVAALFVAAMAACQIALACALARRQPSAEEAGDEGKVG